MQAELLVAPAIPPLTRFRAVPARSGDHHLIRQMLVPIFHGPSAAEFQAQSEDPSYAPRDRLLVRHHDELIAHAHLTRREMHFGGLRLPIVGLWDLAVLPEYRNRGCGQELLRAAERQMMAEQAALGVLRTRSPHFFLRRGWAVWSRHSYSVARAREILSHLRETEARGHDPLRPRVPPLNIRLWRHVERAALVRLYDHNTARSYGPLVRNEAYWRWLIDRRAYDRIYVAIDGPDKLELDDCMSPIVGYAVVREGRIVEMMTAPSHPHAPAQLLARACGDAIEQDLHYVRLDAEPGHPLHDVLVAAGGEKHYHEAESGEVFLAKLFDPWSLLARLAGQLHHRAKQAELPLPCELGLCVNGEKRCLSIRPRCVRLASGRIARSRLECSGGGFLQLVLGHVDVLAAVATGRLIASTRLALEAAAALFPRLPLWRPPLDDLQA
mgnify:CR=1 FL=1